MPTRRDQPAAPDGVDVDAVTSAVLTASRLLVAIAARSLASAGDAVTLPQFRLMVVLASRGHLKLTAVADELAVNPSTALRMVERLSIAGMVTRAANPTVRREVVLGLTERGRQVVDEVTARRREEIASIVARMRAPQRAALVAALEAFAEAGGEPPAEPPPRELSPLGWS
jgi:DNA-binding MarR family transcriptional regulator